MTTKTNPTTTQLITIIREIPSDLDTPVSIYLRVKDHGPSFLLESVTGGEHLARYSFIGIDPSQVYILRGRDLQTRQRDGSTHTIAIPADQDPLDALRNTLQQFQQTPDPSLPRFAGGLVGYISYDIIRYFEPSVAQQPHPSLPDAIFLHADTLIAIDHAFGRMLLIANAIDETTANRRLDRIEKLLARSIPILPAPKPAPPVALQSNFTRAQYTAAVRTAKAHIRAGDIFQVVPSQRLSRKTTADSFEIYRALRRLNPSPYMFYFDFADLPGAAGFKLIGASPEMHVRLEDRVAALRPIAGTRPRGRNHSEDFEYEQDLLADPKERAEHLMLIDLARNDLGRVCEYGSVHVPEQFTIERYSHVMHIVSQTEGILRPEFDAFDLMRATFPAGTVSGAPKIRAMQIISQLEDDPRGPYAGAVGYFGYDGNADTCIALRTIVMRGDTIHIQAGAGIVADSDPDTEYEETLNKGKALAIAIEMAENQ